MHRFYLPARAFSENYVTTDDQTVIGQLTKVLRAKHGDKFGLFDGSGWEFLGQLIEIDKKKAKFLVIDKNLGKREPKVSVNLYQSLLKSDKLDWVIQKAVELGVSKFIPVVSEYCVARSLTENKLRRYAQIIKEATEQCGGSRLMELAEPIAYKQVVATVKNFAGEKIICWEQEAATKIATAQTDNICIFVGPEGGYSQEEINLALGCGIRPVSLGSRILRAETASIVALAKVMD